MKHSLGHKGSASEPESSSGSELDSELESSSDGDYATDSEDSGPSFLKRKRRVVIEDDSEDEAEIDKRTPRCFKSFELDDSVDPVAMVSVEVDPVEVDQVKLDRYIANMRNHGCMKTKAAIKADWMSKGS